MPSARPGRRAVAVGGAALTLVVAGTVTLWRPDLPAALGALVLRSQVSIADSETAAVYAMPLFWAMLVAVLALEALCPVDPAQPVVSRGLVQDAAYFVLNMAFRAVAISAYVALLKALYDRHLAFLTIQALADWPAPARLVLAVLLVDFLAWLHHYVRHRVPILWRFHAIHHSQRQMNLFTDLRYHPAEYLVTVTVVALPMLAFAHAFPVIFACAAAQQWYTKFYHASIRTDLGPLRHLLVTPQSHRIHHSVEPRHQDRNFGVIFSFWDRLFGTAYHGHLEYPRTGIGDAGFPSEQETGRGVLRTLLAQCLHPLRQWPPPAGRSPRSHAV